MLSVIVPTYNEKKNLAELVDRIKAACPSCEVIIVDDNSADGTAEFARNLGVTTLLRPERTGLASAVIDGFRLAKGDILCVMDADLSHPPEIIPQMLEALKKNGTDIVVGSRFVKGGGQRGLGPLGRFVSGIARWPSRLLTDIRDTTSGFFMLKRSVIAGVTLNPLGYKICLEILAKGKYSKAEEVPIIFANRGEGKSKMKARQYLEYLGHVSLLLKDSAVGKTRKRGKRND